MDKYEPSSLIREMNETGKLFKLPGLRKLVTEAKKLGFRVTVDWDEECEEEVNANNVRMAVHEADEAILKFRQKGKPSGWVLVIAQNKEDWLCDYNVVKWLDDLVERVID